ncbi:PAS domain S-box protein [Clostridium kluyveri]|uniref:PAS domain S-box protein n=1 Tax=Clostridium kluyveri TaxID=1534 RepID=UPI000ABC5C48|nr:PAS domain S-box protein [Clostridium kluyveri]
MNNSNKKMLKNSKYITLILDMQWKIIYGNKKALSSLKYTNEELLSMTVFDLISPDEKSSVMNQLKNFNSEEFHFNTFYCTKDSLKFPVEVSFIPMELNSNKIILNLTRDITLELQREEEIETLASIVEYSEDAILSKDLNDIITSWNKGAEKLYGYKKDEIIGMHISKLIPDEIIGDVEIILDKTKKGMEICHHETTRLTKSGKKIFVSICISPIYNREKKIIGASAIARDMSDKKSKEKQLKEKYEELSAIYEELASTEEELRSNYIELEKAKIEAEDANIAKANFLANMSHEIRTPLNGIIGTIDLISLMEIKECTKPYLEILRNSSTHLLDITNNILDISKIESGKIELHMKVFDLKNMLDTFIREISYACSNKNIKFTYFIDPLVPSELIGDELKLKQILINLFNNSLKFTKKGYISFKVKKISQVNEKVVLEFCIEDTGTGIKEKFKKQIFKKFVYQQAPQNEYYSTTGLGLLISKELVKIMNGDIWFESAENIGSIFSFTAEFLLYFDKSVDSKLIPADTIPHTLNKNILIVEDNEINMQIACGMLKRLGYNFSSAYNGNQALKILETMPVHLILMDIQMPELNGLETTKIIRKNELHEKYHMPIIAMTAYAMPGDRELCIEGGMDDYISKPFDIYILKNILQRFL